MTMLECQKYRKKPVVIEAIRYSGDNLAEVLAFTGKHPRFDEWFSSFDEYAAHVASDRQLFKILTLEGTMEASPGDWIIKGVKGEFYPCKPDIFEATYDPPLSTVTPAEVGGLVEELNECAEMVEDGHQDNLTDFWHRETAKATAETCRQAVTALEAQAAELAAVKAENAELRHDIASYVEASSNLATELFDTEAALSTERAAHAETRKALEPFADIADTGGKADG